MTMRVVLGALVSALMVVAVGCNPECVDQYDCANHKGNAPSGQQWTCTNNTCMATDITPTPGTDAGTKPDAGTPTDAGTPPDAGMPTDAGTAPDMSIAEGGACSTTASCMAGLYCDAAKACSPLQVVVTNSTPAQTAVVVPYKAPGTPSAPAGTTSPTSLSETSGGKVRFPRWNKDGTAVAFVEEDSSGNVTLVSRGVPLVTGQKDTLTTGSAASTTDFRYMEWEPGPAILWTTKTATSTSGISSIAPGGTLQTYTMAGVFPSWSGDGSSFAYSLNSMGLKVRSVSTGKEGAVDGVTSSTAEQPLFNKTNGVVLYLDAKGATESFGGSATPLTALYTPLVAPATDATLIADVTTATGSSTIYSYIFNHTWSPLGTHVAYVRVYYTKDPTTGTATLCNDGSPCAGQVGNVVFVRRLNTDGTPSGDEMQLASEATLPSFSPDGQFIAYLSGGKLFVQQIDPAATDAGSLKKGTAIKHDWGTGTKVESSFGDDDRPRWQPR